MRFNDDETDLAIRILTNVWNDSGKPLEAPAKVYGYRCLADSGDTEAYVLWMTAAMRMLYPVIPPEESGQHPCSQREVLWNRIVEGHLEGIRIARALNYDQAWADTAGGTLRAPYGSYFDAFCTTAVRNTLVRILLEDGRWSC